MSRTVRWGILGVVGIALTFAAVGGGIIVLAERGLSHINVGTLILYVIALPAVAMTLFCLNRAFEERQWRGKATWIGRALGMGGAALAVSGPAGLFNEVVFLIGRGGTPGAWFPRAIDYQGAMIPFTVIPALAALRWPRLGAGLFVIAGLFDIYQRVYQPFGVIFPEATQSGPIGIPVLDAIIQPAFIVAAFLLLGSVRFADEGHRRPATTTAGDGSSVDTSRRVTQ